MDFVRDVKIQNCLIQKDLVYRGQVLVKITINYPYVYHDCQEYQKINSYYKAKALKFYHYIQNIIYMEALKDYLASQNQYPFHTYEMISEYHVTYNEHCHLSLNTDAYQFTGGAHGNTLRSSETWDIVSEKRLSLSDLLGHTSDEQNIKAAMLQQASDNIKQNPGIYFENYQELMMENFDLQSFYLDQKGLNLYYQEYEIAPYSTGIVVFVIPYQDIPLKIQCKVYQ